MEDDYLNATLLAAVESGSPSATYKLILHGATNLDEALTKSRKLEKPTVTAALLIIKAAIVNDRILVMKLYGENVQGEMKIPLTEEDSLAEFQAAVASESIKTMIPIKISQVYNASAVMEVLLLQTDVNQESGKVGWHGLNLTQLETSWLINISWVEKLRLSHNELKSLPPDMGDYLQQCTSLELQCNSLQEIPQCLLQLPSISKLNLSRNNLSAIPAVPKWSASLSFLDLSHNSLSDLPNSTVAPALKNLNISNNQFQAVPHCVCFFIGLTTLDIAYNSKIVALPNELGKLKNLLSLNLDGLNILNNPPKSDRTTTAKCIQYLSDQLRSPRGYYCMKMVVVGKRAAGKSTLVSRLNNKEIGDESMINVDISEWRYTPRNKETFRFSIWDLASQEEYNVIHQCFLSKHSLYLIVWKVTEGAAGIAGLKPWLDSISARVPDSYVIIVGTFLDKVSNDDRQSGKLDDLLQEVEELTRHYRLVVKNITAVGLVGHMENINKLKDYIYNAAAEYKVNNQYVMGQMVPSSYHALDAEIHRLVKEKKHKPVMHTADFKKMVQDLHLVDIQDDDDELHKVTHFLHEAGLLLHYDDQKYSLDDLYFVDPCWLCDLISTFLAVAKQNSCVKRGILKNKDIPLLFKDRHYPSKYLYQYLTLLNRFEIVLPLGKDYKRVLVPSTLPKGRPNVVTQQYPVYKSCYQRFILFRPATYQDQSSHYQIPPGFWSRLLSDIINTIKEIKDIISEKIPVEDNISTDVHCTENVSLNDTTIDQVALNRYAKSQVCLENSFASETSSAISNVPGPLDSMTSTLTALESSTDTLCEESYEGSVEVFPVEGGGSLFYCRTGLVYSVSKLFFSIESLAQNPKYSDKDGVLILASQGAEGCKILRKLIDIVEKLISAYYPGLRSELEQRVPCPECLKTDDPNPFEFRVDQLITIIVNHEFTHMCDANHKVHLIEIVPDELLADFNSTYLLDSKEVIYKQDNESLLAAGAFGNVFYGKYKGQEVAVKLYTVKQNSKVEESFKKLHSESKILQQLYHPSLVCMVGITICPTMSLVLEAGQGSLQALLLREQRAILRIIIYRIAIQVVSALHFLHSNNIIFRDLNADSVLLWSLSPDHLINCKVVDFNIAADVGPGGIKDIDEIEEFSASEVSGICDASEHSVYDQRSDIFSFGMFLYQILARRHPFHNLPDNIEVAIEDGKRPQLEDVSVAEVGLYYMTRIMKLCWNGNPVKRPSCQQVIEWLSASALQLIISVIPVNNKHSICNGCIVTPDTSNKVGLPPTSSELWICCDEGGEGDNDDGGGEVSIFTTNTMVKVHCHSVRGDRMHFIGQCGQYVWVLKCDVVYVFNCTTKDLVHSFEMKENTVSCITYTNDLVYLGTMEGNCLVFPANVADIQPDTGPYYVCISEHCVDGLALTKTCLWASVRDQIHFLDPQTLELEGVEKRKQNKGTYVGKMMLSDNGDLIWSAHLGGVILSAWNARECTHITDVDVCVCAEEHCHINDLQDRIITAMCTALDTVWIGLSSGYIMVFAMSPPGELLTYFRPYDSFVCFLSATKYPGPCQKEECMMLCGGKMYRPDDSFKELPDYTRKDEKGEPMDSSGVVVLWEVLPAKYTRQVQYLSEGTSWLNYSTLQKTMNDTGFTDSMQYCQSMVNSSTTAAHASCK